MSSQADVTEYLHMLDSTNLSEVQGIKDLIIESLSTIKEAWLLNAVVDFYLVSHSQRCLDILSAAREPHDKQLFDRLVECIKGQHKLPAITIIGHLVSKPPPWLHKITNHSLMKHIIQVMKTEVDVPILVTAVLTITSLLPTVPVSVQNYIQDILDAFSRLAGFNFAKSGNVPDIYLLHLHVAIYSLFHRMHGMFPCHLIYYLRSYYSKKDNQSVFDSKIAPMLERVRMHPLLVTASKEKEVSRERWKNKEVHDIIVDCAHLSLDMIEGSTERISCPFYDGITETQTVRPGFTNLNAAIQQNASSSQSVVAQHSIINSADVLSSMWSPAIRCGLSTPPPSAAASNSSSAQDSTVSSQPGIQLPSTRNTPYVHESPHPVVDPLTPIPTQPVELQPLFPVMPTTPGGGPSGTNKRLSAMSLSLSGRMPSTPAADIVPPSPQKFEFSSEPPLHAQKMQAIRKLNFQGQSDEENNPMHSRSDQSTHSVASHESTSKSSVGKVSDTGSEGQGEPSANNNPLSPQKRRRPPPLKNLGTADTFDFGSEDNKQVDHSQDNVDSTKELSQSQSVPSVKQLPDFIDNLQGNTGEMGADDEEVQELTSSREMLDRNSTSSDDSMGRGAVSLTAQSVKAFMKNVNRIRFNSMNVGKLREISQDDSETNIKRSRSNSCPDLEQGLPGQGSYGSHRVRSHSGSGSSASDTSLVTTGKSSTPTKSASGVSFTAEPLIEEEEEVETNVEYDEGAKREEDIENFLSMFPYHHLFPMALPAAPFMKCYNCKRSDLAKETKKEAEDYNIPLFSYYSPPDLLDIYLKMSSQLHYLEVDALDCPTKTSAAYLHYGGALAYPEGLPPTEEMKILRGEIQLLHNQVIYERQKRELYAKRNRRLLGKITKATALEEQNNAMHDQLKLQENEIVNLQVTVRLQQEQIQELKQLKERFEKEKQELQKTLRVDVDKLQNDKRDLQSVVDTILKENKDLKRDLQSTKSQMFNVIQELNSTKAKADISADLQEQVTRLNKELLLMGELQQKYRQRLMTTATMHNPKPEMQFVLETYKQELAATKLALNQKTVNYDALVATRTQQEEAMAAKDTAVAEHKRKLEEMNAMWKVHHEAAEEKYKAQKKTTAALEAEVLRLTAEVEGRKSSELALNARLESESRLSELAGQGGATASGGADLSPQSDSHVEEARECRETPPSDHSPLSPPNAPLGNR